MGLHVRTALAEAARARGLSTGFDREIRTLTEQLSNLTVEAVETEDQRRAVAAASTETDQLQEEVAQVRGELIARREGDAETETVAEQFRDAARDLSEAETTAAAARQNLDRRRRKSRAARDRLEDNDAESTATTVPSASQGSRIETYDLLKVAAGDEDYFAVDLDAGDRLNATVTHLESSGDVNLSLVAPDGNVTYGTDLNAHQRQFGGTKGQRKLRATASSSAGGRYYVAVTGSRRAALKYNLTINTTAGSSRFDVGMGADDFVTGIEIDTAGWNDRRLISEERLEEIERAVAFEELGIKPELTPEPGTNPRFSAHGRTTLPESVPPLEQQLVTGDRNQYLVLEHDESVAGGAKVRVSVQKDTLRETGVSADEVSVFRHGTDGEEGGWERLDTETVDEAEESVTFLAESSAPGEGTTDGEGSGFGVLPALVALLTAVTAAARRH
jgi:type II secretory pathway pseudopilin PulG